jgi:NADH-quinone oxidoreductase subunit D
MYTWRDREAVMNLLAALTGNRVNYGINTIGGVRRDINPEQAQLALHTMALLEERTKYYITLASEEITLHKRLSGVGHLSREDALALGAVGPVARASGVARDVRRDDPYAAYPDLDFRVITNENCDVFGRTLVRLGELMESFSMIRQLVANIPEGPLFVRAPRKIPAGEAISRFEAPRGEDVHYVKADGTDKPERVKVRAPTLANIQTVAKMLENRQLADLPIVIAAIDPCFSCTDRMVSIAHADSGSTESLSLLNLHAYGIEWYKSRGVDFSTLNAKLATAMEDVKNG